MKKITAGLAVIFFLALGASAQEKPNGHHGHHKGRHRQEVLKKDLNLTENQKQQLKAVNETYHKQLAELNKNESITVKEMRDRKASLAKEHRTSIQGILTAEQKAKVEANRQKSRDKRQEMQAQRMDKMKKDLALTNDQASKLKSMNEGYKTKMESLKKDESLDRTAKKEQFKALHEKHKAEIKDVLTQEQIQKLEEMRKNRGERG
jgi:periplasmic protein CpxP/Spy